MGSGTVVATIVRSPSRTTTIEPRPRSTWTRSTAGPSGRSAAAAARSSSPAAASARDAFVPGRVRRLHRAAGSRDHGLDHLRREPDELRESGGRVHAGAGSYQTLRRSLADWAPSCDARDPSDLRPLLLGAGHPPRGDGRLLRARVLRAPDLPRALGARLPRPGRLVERARLVPRGRLPRPVGGVDRQRRRRRATERDDAVGRRRGRAALELALALLGARVGVQHPLRAPEPLLPARQGARDACT